MLQFSRDIDGLTRNTSWKSPPRMIALEADAVLLPVSRSVVVAEAKGEDGGLRVLFGLVDLQNRWKPSRKMRRVTASFL